MYGKLFSQIYDGTLGNHWQALVTFQQLIVLSDVEGVVDMTAEALSKRTGIPLDIIRAGLEVLEAPDPESRTPDEEGRRLVRLSDARTWGWRIVNYAKYCNLRDESARRDYHREYYRTHRAKGKTTQPASTTLNRSQPAPQQNSTSIDVSVPITKSLLRPAPKPTGKPRKVKASPTESGKPTWGEEVREAALRIMLVDFKPELWGAALKDAVRREKGDLTRIMGCMEPFAEKTKLEWRKPMYFAQQLPALIDAKYRALTPDEVRRKTAQ